MNAVLEQFKNQLAESWNASDKALREDFLKFREEHKEEKFDIGYGYKVCAEAYYIDKHGLTKDESEIIWHGLYGRDEKNMKDAEKFVKNLEARIVNVTGEIEEITDYCTENGKGWKVKGQKANAIVLQIMAGGYNIVRLHVRNLIKVVK